MSSTQQLTLACQYKDVYSYVQASSSDPGLGFKNAGGFWPRPIAGIKTSLAIISSLQICGC